MEVTDVMVRRESLRTRPSIFGALWKGRTSLLRIATALFLVTILSAVGTLQARATTAFAPIEFQEFGVSTPNAFSNPNGAPANSEFFLFDHDPGYALTAGADGAMWFAETNSGKVGRIVGNPNDTQGLYSKNEFSLPGGGEPQGIAAGSDLGVYVTVAQAEPFPPCQVFPAKFQLDCNSGGSGVIVPPPESIVRIQVCLGNTCPDPPGYQMQQWFLGDAGQKVRVGQIIAGPDGNMYFLMNVPGSDQREIGQISEVGNHTMSFYTLPRNLGADSLAFDPDGFSLWLIDNQHGYILKEPGVGAPNFPIAQLQPWTLGEIIKGTDGMWFTEPGNNKIGHVSSQWCPGANGTRVCNVSLTEISVPQQNAGIYSLALGPDGTVWFPEKNTGILERYNPSTGNFSSVTPASTTAVSGGPNSIAASGWSDQNGSLWAIEDKGNELVRLGRAYTSTTVSSSPSPSTEAEPVTLSATVNDTDTVYNPTGSVTFIAGPGTNNPTPLPGCTLAPVPNSHSSACSVTTTVLPVGTYQILAEYSGNASYVPSDGFVQQTVNPLPIQ